MRSFLLLLLSAVTLSAAPFWTAGAPTPPIVISENDVDPVRQAADELALWLGKATNEPWIVTTKAPADGRAFYLGEAARLGNENVPKPEDLPPDGYWLSTTEDSVRISGRDYRGGPISNDVHPMRPVETWSEKLRLSAIGDMGTWNGVHQFLETLGFRWYMPGEDGTVIPKLTEIHLPEATATTAPHYEYRYAWLCNFESSDDSALWYRRIGYGAPAPVNINHTYFQALDEQEKHPEWFALIDGKRDFTNLSCVAGGGNLCLSNPEVKQMWIDRICDYFRRNPDQEIHPLCPNDGMIRICECPDCQAQLSPHLGEYGKFSNYVWNFANEVAKGVYERMPNKRVGCFSYEYYREVPDCLQEVSPNLAVMLCYQRQQFRDPAYKEACSRRVKEWSKFVGAVYLWTYPHLDYWSPWRQFPRFYPTILAEDLRANQALPVKGEFLESESHNWNERSFEIYDFHWPALYHLTPYVTSKLLWNPQADYRAILEEYYQLFYGPASAPMKEFWTKVEQNTLSKNAKHPAVQFSLDELRDYQRLQKEAIALCPEGSVFRRRCQELYDEMKPAVESLLKLAKRETIEIPFSTETLPCDGMPPKNAFQGHFVGKNEEPIERHTDFNAIADPEGLLCTFVCYEDSPEHLSADPAKKAAAIWDDDSVEVHLCRPDNTDGLLLILNLFGDCFSARWKSEAAPDDKSWKPVLPQKVTTSFDSWTLQVKIPWSELGVDPTQDDVILKGQFYRNRQIQPRVTEHSALAPTYVYNHRVPAAFLPIRLKK